MERIVTLEELKELRTHILSSNVSEEEKRKIVSFLGMTQNTDSTASVEKGKTLVKKNPSVPSLLEKDTSTTSTLFEKAGFSNAIYLATISLVFEVLFLAVSFFIYK